MSRFHGNFLLMLSFFLTSLMTGMANPLVELSTRSELVEQAGYGEEKLSSVLVIGTVLCVGGLDGEAGERARPLSGALVGVSCKTGRKKMKLINWAQVTTDDYGEFTIDLPSHLHAIPNLDKVCSVRVLRLPRRSPCRRAAAGKPNSMKLSSVGNSIRTYTVESIRLERIH